MKFNQIELNKISANNVNVNKRNYSIPLDTKTKRQIFDKENSII